MSRGAGLALLALATACGSTTPTPAPTPAPTEAPRLAAAPIAGGPPASPEEVPAAWRACRADDDCALVVVGEFRCCSTTYRAVHAAHAAEAQARLGTPAPEVPACLDDCAASRAACVGGTCEVR
ncbi:MAG: hypothetical protein R2939_14480 [Kofleriaceae bacterium]